MTAHERCLVYRVPDRVRVVMPGDSLDGLSGVVVGKDWQIFGCYLVMVSYDGPAIRIHQNFLMPLDIDIASLA